MSNNPLAIVADKIGRGLAQAFSSLRLRKMRAFLSVLGIIIGTGSVISLMAFGEGSMLDALEDIKRQGATNIIVRSVMPPPNASTQRMSRYIQYGLTYDDYDKFHLLDSVIGSVPMRIFPQEVRRQHRMILGRVVGTTADYRRVNPIQVLEGRFLIDADEPRTSGDDVELRNVCVLGHGVARFLFPFEKPVGQTVVLNRQYFVVVGVLAPRLPTGASGGTASAEEFDHDVYVPLSTCRARWGERIYLRQSGSRLREEVELHQVTLTISEMDKVRQAGDTVRALLERNHTKKDWSVTIPLDRLEEAERARDRYKLLLVLIASISLLVGGIGIMNIMLATVTERTREIGIRRALGAKRRDITLQFLVEAVVQTGCGGIFGVLLGFAVVYGLPWIALQVFDFVLPAKLHVPSVFLALGVSIGVGILFGWYPARRASRLDPIQALRHN